MKAKTNRLNTILKLIATFFVVPLVIGTFFSGFVVKADGSSPSDVSIFEFVLKKDVWLALAFVCTVLLIILVVFSIFYGITKTMSVKRTDNFIGILILTFELILSLAPFFTVLIYCVKNSVKGLKYSVGVCPILSMVCGIVFGVLMLASYVIKPQNQKISDKSTTKSQIKK